MINPIFKSKDMRTPYFFNLLIWFSLIALPGMVFSQSSEFTLQDVTFESQGVTLAGSILTPDKTIAAVVIVHGSDPVKREMAFATRLAKAGIAVLTYDKRGVGQSGGVYVGPTVGTNNIDPANLELLAQDANAAVKTLQKFLQDKKTPIGLLGFSQAGWVIPIAASHNPLVAYMVLFSCPTITTLEQLRFQFYTNGNNNFWDNHTEADALEHIKNDPDRYQFTATDPKKSLENLSIPGLWLFGEKDIQIPAKLCMAQLNALKAKGKNFDYVLFQELGHNTAFDNDTAPVDIAMQWIKREALRLQKSKGSK